VDSLPEQNKLLLVYLVDFLKVIHYKYLRILYIIIIYACHEVSNSFL